MKKLLAIMLAAVIALSIAGCAAPAAQETVTAEETAAPQETEAAEETVATQEAASFPRQYSSSMPTLTPPWRSSSAQCPRASATSR